MQVSHQQNNRALPHQMAFLLLCQLRTCWRGARQSIVALRLCCSQSHVATCSAVRCRWLRASTGTPAASNRRTSLRFAPGPHAMMSAVDPCLFVAKAFAPRSNKKRAISDSQWQPARCLPVFVHKLQEAIVVVEHHIDG